MFRIVGCLKWSSVFVPVTFFFLFFFHPLHQSTFFLPLFLHEQLLIHYDNVTLTLRADVLLSWVHSSVEDVSDLWPSVKEGFEERLPLKKALLSNKTRNTVNVENLSAEFILTTDSRLRSRFSQELSVFWFREPYATVVLVTCEVHDKSISLFHRTYIFFLWNHILLKYIFC